MKNILICILAFSLQVVAHSQTIQKADSISPKDFGAHKWILSGTASENEVLIFRVTTSRDRKDNPITEVYDSVHYLPDKEIQMSAFFYDPNYFDMTRTEEPEWFFKALEELRGSRGNGHVQNQEKTSHRLALKAKSGGRPQSALKS